MSPIMTPSFLAFNYCLYPPAVVQRWKLRPDHLEEFVELWAEYDDGSGTIDPKDLEAMLLRWAVGAVLAGISWQHRCTTAVL